MSNSTEKMDVIIDKFDFLGGKKWVLVRLKNGRTQFFPSFEDLHRIIQSICECEEEKYPNGEGRNMVAKFVRDCCNVDDYDQLAKIYKIPVRNGRNIVDTNGAKLL